MKLNYLLTYRLTNFVNHFDTMTGSVICCQFDNDIPSGFYAQKGNYYN